jgi:hypothetical protein
MVVACRPRRWWCCREHPPHGRNPPKACKRPELHQYPADHGNSAIGWQPGINSGTLCTAVSMHRRPKPTIPDYALPQPPSCLNPSPNCRQSRDCPLLQTLSQTCWCFFSGLSGLGGRRKQETSQPPPGISPSLSLCLWGRSKVRAARACCCNVASSDLTSAPTGCVLRSPNKASRELLRRCLLLSAFALKPAAGALLC